MNREKPIELVGESVELHDVWNGQSGDSLQAETGRRRLRKK